MVGAERQGKNGRKEVKEQQGQNIDDWRPGESSGFSWSEMGSHCKFLSKIVA